MKLYCLNCEKKKAKWPPKEPTFCTQRCAANYGFGKSDDETSCETCGKYN